MMPKTIVIPLDGSPLAERAVSVAMPLARELGSDVVLVATPWDHDPRAPRSYLDGVATRTAAEGLEALVVDAPAAEAIRRTAHERPASLVCMTTHGRGRLRWAVAGSVAEDVIRGSSDPLLLVGPRGEDTWARPERRVVVCVDGSASSQATTEHACEWAKALDLEVHLVCATHPLDVEATGHPEGIFGPLEAIVRDEGLPVHRDQLFRSAFLAGALVDFAEELTATLMVMSAHRHRSLARATLGSTTMAVLNIASCPVLVVPPGQT